MGSIVDPRNHSILPEPVTIPSINTQWPWINGDQTYYEFAFTSTDITALDGMNIYIGENSAITKVSQIITTYSFTKSAENGSITVSVGGSETEEATFDRGSEIVLTASTDVAGYEFDKWTDGTNVLAVGGNISSISGNVVTITMNSDMSVTALFKLQQFTVTAVSEDNSKGTVSFSSGSSGGSVDYNTELTLTATPESGYSFKSWMNGETQVSTDANYTFNVTEAINLTAEFEAEAPVITPIFTEGVADLSKFEVQDAGKVTYDTELHKITVTEGWNGVQVTATSADDVQGKELRITFSEAAKVKATVKYADETATDTIMSDASTILYMVINGTKKVSQIQIQPTEVGSVTLSEVKVNAESTKPAEPEPTPGQTGVDISLTDLNEGWNSEYNATTKTITTTGDWGARGWYIGDDRYNDKGSITVKFNAVEHAVTLKMEYTNANDEAKDVSAGAAAGETEITLDIPANAKTIDKVYITFEPTGTLTLTEATVNDKVVDNGIGR